MAGKFGGRDAFAAEFIALIEDVRVGDFLVAHADIDVGAIVGDQKRQLFEQISAEGARLGDGRRIDARALEFGIGADSDGCEALPAHR